MSKNPRPILVTAGMERFNGLIAPPGWGGTVHALGEGMHEDGFEHKARGLVLPHRSTVGPLLRDGRQVNRRASVLRHGRGVLAAGAFDALRDPRALPHPHRLVDQP